MKMTNYRKPTKEIEKIVKVTRNHLVSVNVKLNSQSFFANSESLPILLALDMLLSVKYSPLTPSTLGFNAT